MYKKPPRGGFFISSRRMMFSISIGEIRSSSSTKVYFIPFCLTLFNCSL
jgi:hypothetical protein